MKRERTVEWMGWRPDLPDFRDEPYLYEKALSREIKPTSALPPRAQPQRREVDRHPVRDQGPTGSCVGHGVGFIAAIERNVVQRSALAIYAEARKIIGELDRDDGAYIRDGARVVGTLGAPAERRWPFDIAKLHVDPSESADRDALKRKVFSYHRLQGGQEFRSCLASGHLFTIGFTVYSSLSDPLVERFGIVNWPAGRAEGGHCVAVIGYEDDFPNSEWGAWARNEGYPERQLPARVYECQNSWGEDWGRRGRFVIDAEYLEHRYLAGDAWTLRGFEDSRR